MKVLIVDDEKHVRTSIRLLIDWHSIGVSTVLEAENGFEASGIIEQEQPEIVIMDIMMPVQSGIELMNWLTRHDIDCKKIVISGHNDFEYARQTIKHGGIDYLLKPIDQLQLQKALDKAVESLNETRRQRMKQQQLMSEVNVLKPVYLDKLLSALLAESGLTSVHKSLYQEIPDMRGARFGRIAVISFEIIESAVKEKFAAHIDDLVFIIDNVANEFLREASAGVAFRHLNSKVEMVLLMWCDPKQAEAWVQRIQQAISGILGASFDIGLGLALPFPDELGQSYRQALEALHNRNLLDRSKRIHDYKEDAAGASQTLQFANFEEAIRYALRSGNAQQIHVAVRQWFDYLHTLKSITFRQFELWHNEYQIAKARWRDDFFQQGTAGEEGLPSPGIRLEIPVADNGNLSLARLQQEIADDLVGLSRRMTAIEAQQHNIMLEIARYIRLNYRSVTLDDLSNRFFLTREHISRRFKHEFHETITNFVNRIRIEHAKVLLLNPHMRMSQISQAVGYQDEKYFSRVFKKFTGVSPNDYRTRQEERQ